jgi:hypothetical protein
MGRGISSDYETIAKPFWIIDETVIFVRLGFSTQGARDVACVLHALGHNLCAFLFAWRWKQIALFHAVGMQLRGFLETRYATLVVHRNRLRPAFLLKALLGISAARRFTRWYTIPFHHTARHRSL